MLTHTFVHLPRVGHVTERRLWQVGLYDWERALDCRQAPGGFSAQRWAGAQRLLEESRRCLERREHRFFAQNLAPADHWRALPEFSDRRVFLDIETTGMGPWAQITLIGMYDGQRSQTYVAGENLNDFCEDLDQYAMVVTFNGATFDLPFLCRCFSGMPRDFLHVDLRYALRRLGLNGGLKAIERRLGLARETDLAGLSGEDAARLWREYSAGDERALELLVRYNVADVENLETLVEWAYPRLRQQATSNAQAEQAGGRRD
jgi:uncharacterized protein YprB with RNaseH-like and TPR domain